MPIDMLDNSESSHREHQYAFNAQGDWVSAKQTTSTDNQIFFCECPKKHKLKLVKPSGICGKRSFRDYFAHIQHSSKKHKSDETQLFCIPSSESLEHRIAKHRLREMAGFYFFSTFRCKKCEWEKIIETTGCSVSIEVVSDDRRWRYDCLLKKATVEVAALEVFHTHLTGSEKARSVRSSGLEIAEFRSLDVLKLTKGCKTKLDNLQICIGLCIKCLRNASYRWLRRCWLDEQTEVIKQENMEWKNYELNENLKRKFKKRYEFLLNESKVWMTQCFYDELDELIAQEDPGTEIANYELSVKLMKQREQRLIEKSKAWKLWCFLDEIEAIQQHESLMSIYYNRQHDLRAALQIADPIKQCQALIALSLHRLKIEVPNMGIISFTTSQECINGVLVYGFNKQIPTQAMCIVLISGEIPVQWKHNQVEIPFHIFLHCSKLLRELGSLKEASVVLKDCRWPSLMSVEEIHGICANCGLRGHKSNKCRSKFCMKCGRKGHLQRGCFSRKDVINQNLTRW
jgi:hypothetical protein